MEKKWAFVLVGIVTIGLLLAGSARAANEPVVLKLGSAPIGGSQYTMGIALEQLWNSKIPGVRVSSQATGGSVQNLNFIGSREVQIGFTASTLAKMAMAGTGPYKGNPIKDVRILSYVYPGLFHLVVRNIPEIKTVENLKGMKVSCGEIGSVMEIAFKQAIDGYGMSESSFKIEHLSHSDAGDALRDGHIDAFFYATSAPNSVITDLMVSKKGKILPLEEGAMEKAVKQHSDIYKTVIPSGAYPNQKEDIPTLSCSYILVVDASVPTDAVYQLVKTMYESNADLVKRHKFFSYATLNNALNGLGGVPLHPGAEKYLKEKGVIK